MKKLLSLVLIIAGLAIGFCVLPSVVPDVGGSIAEKLESGDESTLATQVSEIAELAVIEYKYTDAVTLKDKELIQEEHKLPFTDKNIVMIYEGTLKIGVDTKQIDLQVDREDGEVTGITVELPETVILSNEVNRDSIEFPVEKSTIFNKLTKEDYDLMEIRADEKVRERVKKNGTIDRATDEVKTAITNYLIAVYGKEITVKFK